MRRQRNLSIALAHHRLSSLSLCLLILLAFALRVYRLDYQELRGDEAFGYFFSLRSFDDIVQATIALKEPHPVASYFLQHSWLSWAGHSEFALRFINVWFGVLAVALLYRLARSLGLTRAVAWLAAFFLAVSPYAIWHSQDARMYSMSLALTTASTWLAIAWLPRQRWPQTVAYLAVSWLALNTHYFSVFVLAAQSAFVLSRALFVPRLRFTLFSWVSLQGLLLVLYLPWLVRVGSILTNYSGNGDSPGWFAMVRRALSVFAVGESVPINQQIEWAGLAALLLCLGGVALVREPTTGRRALWLLALYLAVPLLATWYGARQRPIFNERYLIAAAPPFYVLVAAALPTTVRWVQRAQGVVFWRVGVSALLFGLLLGDGTSLQRYYTDPLYSKTRGWRTLATALTHFSAGFAPEQVRIAQNFPDPTLWYYYTGPVEHIVLPPAAHDEAGAQQSVDQLHAAQVQRVLLPKQPAPNWDNQGIAATALMKQYELVREQTVGVWPMQIYAQRSSPLTALTVTFRNGVTLAGSAVQPQQLTPGNLLTVQLAWQMAQAHVTGSEKVFVQLLNPQGQLVAQDDRPLANQAALATYGILLPDQLPAGEYQLITGLYDPAQPGAPRILTYTGANFVTLRTMTVMLSP